MATAAASRLATVLFSNRAPLIASQLFFATSYGYMRAQGRQDLVLLYGCGFLGLPFTLVPMIYVAKGSHKMFGLNVPRWNEPPRTNAPRKAIVTVSNE